MRNALWIVLGIVLVIAVLQPGGHDPKSFLEPFSRKEDSSNFETEMQKLLKQVGSDLPKMIDPDTRLDSIERIDKNLQYNYTFVNHTESDLNKLGINDQLRESLHDPACTVLQKEFFRYYNISVRFSYSDKSNKHINTLTFNQNDCKKS